MAGVAIPPVSTPNLGSPAPGQPQAPRTTEHNAEDRIANRLATKLNTAVTAARTAAPQPVQPTIAQPPASGVAVPGSIPAANAPAEVSAEPIDIDAALDGVNFDEPVTVTDPAAPTPAPGEGVVRTPAEIEKLLADELEVAGPDGQNAALWKKLDGLAVQHPRGRQMVEGLKFMRAMAEPPKEDGTGGIGRVLSLDEIKQADMSDRELRLLRHDISNDPASFAANLVRMAENGRSWLGGPEEVSRVLAEIPKVLIHHIQNTNNPVYGSMMAQIAGPIFQQAFDHQYKLADQFPETTEQEKRSKARLIDSLNVIEYRLFGTARGQMPNEAPDPEKLQLRRQAEDTKRQLEQMRQSQVGAIRGAIMSANTSMADSSVDRVFHTLGIKPAFSSVILDSQKREIMIDIDRNLSRLNPGGWQSYTMQLDEVARGKMSPDVPKETYKNMFQSVLRSQYIRPRLNALVEDAKKTLGPNSRIAASQGQVGTDGSGRSAAASVISAPGAPGSRPPAPTREAGQSREDHIASRFAGAIQHGMNRR